MAGQADGSSRQEARGSTLARPVVTVTRTTAAAAPSRVPPTVAKMAVLQGLLTGGLLEASYTLPRGGRGARGAEGRIPVRGDETT
ncbi:MAG: hypothetical protein JW751_10035 [Polyangiaceae bacterium]|nr:hypothetical protein [Polyangiaceae bacterium]